MISFKMQYGRQIKREINMINGFCGDSFHDSGGGGGIRTHETLSRLPVFKTGAFNHSATPPRINIYISGYETN